MSTLDTDVTSVVTERPLCLFAFLCLTSFLATLYPSQTLALCEACPRTLLPQCLCGEWGIMESCCRAEARVKLSGGPDSRTTAFISTVLAGRTTVLVTVQQSSWGVPAVGTKVCFPLQSVGQEPLLLGSPAESGTSPGRNHQFSSPPTKQKELNLN